MKRIAYILFSLLCLALCVLATSAAVEANRGFAVIAVALFAGGVISLVLAVEP